MGSVKDGASCVCVCKTLLGTKSHARLPRKTSSFIIVCDNLSVLFYFRPPQSMQLSNMGTTATCSGLMQDTVEKMHASIVGARARARARQSQGKRTQQFHQQQLRPGMFLLSPDKAGKFISPNISHQQSSTSKRDTSSPTMSNHKT